MTPFTWIVLFAVSLFFGWAGFLTFIALSFVYWLVVVGGTPNDEN